MKKIKVVAAFVAGFAFVYLAVAFCALSIDATEWDVLVRSLFVMIGTPIGFLCSVLVVVSK